MVNKITVGSILLCLILLFLLQRSCEENKDLSSLYAASQDTLSSSRDALGRETVKIAVMEGSYKELKGLKNTQDSTIKKLQELVNKKTVSATIVNSKTSGYISTKAVIMGKDTILLNDTVYVFPEYKSVFTNRWENFDISASKDSIMMNYTLFNEFSIQQRYEKQGVFKPKKLIVEIKNENPHTTTTSMRSFAVVQKKPQRGVIFGVGILTGFFTAYKLLK